MSLKITKYKKKHIQPKLKKLYLFLIRLYIFSLLSIIVYEKLKFFLSKIAKSGQILFNLFTFQNKIYVLEPTKSVKIIQHDFPYYQI